MKHAKSEGARIIQRTVRDWLEARAALLPEELRQELQHAVLKATVALELDAMNSEAHK